MFQPVALELFFDEEDFLQLNMAKDSIRAKIIRRLNTFFIYILLSKLVYFSDAI
ncbi:hypothetical protein GCM10009431_24080 [Gaetbulibacter jejuensis]|uniref:Uncharacterized protein n=1 Tax=Gaetbulibacter jejuensis TaxID=584607 RepID=A0ABP3V3X4_9FLAO